MSRLFDGVDDQVSWLKGEINGTGAFTIAVVAKYLDANGQWGSMFNLIDGVDASKLEFTRRGSSDTLSVFTNSQGNASDSTGPDWNASNGWCLVAVSKAAGTNTPTFTHYPIGGSPTHSAGSATLANAAASLSLLFGHFETTDWFNGNVAAIAMWNSALSDADRASLGSNLNRAHWISLNPEFLVDELDEFQTDYGGTSSRAFIIGTTDDADDPTDWDLWHNEIELLDNFHRPNGAPGTVRWGQAIDSYSIPNIVSNALDWPQFPSLYWKPQQFLANQGASVQLAGGADTLYFLLRLTNPNSTLESAYVVSGQFGGAGPAEAWKMPAGAASMVSLGFANGIMAGTDTWMKATVDGTTISLYGSSDGSTWNLRQTWTDGTISGGGYVGMWHANNVWPGTLDNFAAGSLPTAPPAEYQSLYFPRRRYVRR